MKKKLKEAQRIVNLIFKEYDKIDFKGEVSNNYHDNMRLQCECASEQLNEMEEYVNRKDEQEVNYIYEQLEKTLTYCKAVINLQEMENNLPPCIFG